MSGTRAFVATALAMLALLAGPARAGEADVLSARATCSSERVCLFSVSVRHGDTGWKHYADRFEVLAPDGKVLATRVLEHPHVHEQPFTRELAGVEIPPGVARVSVRAHDSKDGFGGREVELALKFGAPPATEPSD